MIVDLFLSRYSKIGCRVEWPVCVPGIPGGLMVKQWCPPWLPRFKRIDDTALWG